MKLLVTGGMGFIGANFIREVLAKTDHTVVNLDLLTYAANPMNLTDVENHDRYSFVQGDIADAKLVRQVFERHTIDAVVNFAAETHVDRSIHDSAEFIRTNVIGTHRLLEVAQKGRVKRFVHISTDEVYGSLGPHDLPFTELSTISPTSPYAASKASSDHLVLAAHRTHGLAAIVTRCSNNYGPYQHPEKFIPLSVHRLLSNEAIPVYGTGTNVRDWIHVHDHVRALIIILERGHPGEIYNIGGNTERRNIDVARLIIAMMNKSDDMLNLVKDRPGHDFRYAIDFGKITRELSWSPHIPFEDGLQATVRWYVEHPSWLQASTGDDYQRYYQRQYGVRV